MEEIALKAVTRKGEPRRVRREGFIPGILDGLDTTSTPVQLESDGLNKVIARHDTSAKSQVMLSGEEKFGLLEGVQRHPADGNAVHVSVQMVSEDQNVKMQLPIVFHGHGELEHNLLQLWVYHSEVETKDKATPIPDEIVTGASGKKAGEVITIAGLYLPAGVRLIALESETYAVVKPVRVAVVGVGEETRTVTDETADQSWSEKIDSPLLF